MSGDQSTLSFGEPNAQQPPTPQETPTSAVFPSPVFETPKAHRGSLDDSSPTWTPRFADEYSVFNTTPGNLRGGSFSDRNVSTPYQHQSFSASRKRPLSAENIAAQIASHVNYLSPDTNIPLPPVDPSKRLSSSASGGPLDPAGSPIGDTPQDDPTRTPREQQPGKRVRRGTLQEVHPQTATPPPSARKGERKLAPKLQPRTMQDDQGFGQDFVIGTQQQQHHHHQQNDQHQHNMANFVTTPTDMFNFPMSGPATAPAFTDSRPFWDTDMGAMDIDFSSTPTDMFQAPSGHRPMNSLDWGKSNEMFQAMGTTTARNQENNPPHQAKKERAIAPKPPTPVEESSGMDTSMFGQSFATSMDGSFGMMGTGSGVDPGLLFSRPPSSSMDAPQFDPMAESSMMQSFSQPEMTRPAQLQPEQLQSGPGGLRRSASSREIGSSKKVDRASASSPVKPTGRPGLTRSFSENRGPKTAGGRSSTLPTLAPAMRPMAQPAKVRSASQGGPRAGSGGRISPLKTDHHRLSSLSSIPENAGPKTRTSVKFTIDSRGRARAETTTIAVDSEDDTISPTKIRGRARHLRDRRRSNGEWASSEDDASSTDDEPIIIPSRNTSFTIPEPQKSSLASSSAGSTSRRQNPPSLHTSQRSVSEHSAGSSSLGIYYNDYPLSASSQNNDAESEAETVMNGQDTAGSGRGGDAASELRKVVENRQKKTQHQQQLSAQKPQRFVSGPAWAGGNASSNHDGGAFQSPTTFRAVSTPFADPKRGRVRCICNHDDANKGGANDYMVQCESCEMFLHGKCINITRQTLPRVYVCAFCVNTPNAHGARGREVRRSTGVPNPRAANTASSPLAHKSFQSFR